MMKSYVAYTGSPWDQSWTQKGAMRFAEALLRYATFLTIASQY